MAGLLKSYKALQYLAAVPGSMDMSLGAVISFFPSFSFLDVLGDPIDLIGK